MCECTKNRAQCCSFNREMGKIWNMASSKKGLSLSWSINSERKKFKLKLWKI